MIRLIGNSSPAFLMAPRTRSVDSLTAVSGRPTILNAGRPGETSTSTLTKCVFIPRQQQQFTIPSNVVTSIKRLCYIYSLPGGGFLQE